MFTMSYVDALEIQWKQISWYRKHLKRAGIKKLRSITFPCPPGIHPDEKIPVITINKLVPRGGSIESIINALGTWRY